MPYFVYRIDPPMRLTHIDTKDRYKDARELVRGQRKMRPEGQESEYRMVFAKSQGEAERLLSTPRDERVIGED
jgi:hypothetical protein